MIDFKSTFKIAVLSLKTNKMRSCLTSLGIIIGVAAVIVMLAIGTGASTKVTKDMESMGSNLLTIRSAAANQAGVRQGAGSKPSLTLKDAIALNRLARGVEAVAPVSNEIYAFLHKLCKVHSTNIFTIFGQPIGICARCIGSYIAASITMYMYLHKFKMNKVVFIILGTLAIGEIVAEYFALFYANDFIRLLDGFFLGSFLGMFFIKILDWLEGKKGW